MLSLRNILILCVFGTFTGLHANPVANFSLSKTQGCVPLTVAFTDLSTGTGLSYSWDFGNGNRSTLKNPSAIYYQPGKFKITLTVTDANGNKSSKVFNPVKVFSNPSAAFSADTVGCIGQDLNFTDLSIKADTTIVKWTWDFGDGSLSNSQNPNHAFTYSSKFSIGLTVTDGYGCKSLTTKQNYIRIKPSPKPAFTLNETYSCKLPGVFKATNTTPGTNTYKWECSDGSSSVNTDFTSNIGSFGKYTITLSASSGGCTTKVTKSVNIERLVARFGLNQGGVCEGGKTSFINATTPNNSGIKYEWDFGDGGSDTARSPKYTFNTPGSYTVKLKVSYGACTDEMTQQITVNPQPKVDISIVDSIGCKAPFKAEFNIYGNDYTSSVWDFGDNTDEQIFSKGVKIEHIYGTKGSFNISAKVTNSFGCQQEFELTENIHIATQWVKINPEELNGCLPKSAEFTIKKNILQPIESINWLITDSSKTYTGEKVNKKFDKPGNFLAIVTIRTYMGCLIRDTAEISVGNKYVPTFYIKNYHICGKDTIHYVNTTPDSIKSKLKFSFKFVPQNDYDTGSYVHKDSLIVTKRGGIHVLKMKAEHFGCETESEVTDTVYAHGPYISLHVRSLNCRNDMVEVLTSYKWGNRYSLKKDDTMEMPYHLGRFQQKYEPNYYVFRGWNDTFGCYDTIIQPQVPLGNVYYSAPEFSLNQNCAPAKGTFISKGNMKKVKWVFPNGDSSTKHESYHTFTKAGTYKVLLVGTYDSTNCPDSNILTVYVDGIKLRSTVLSSSKCMPMKLTLIDSTAGTDNHYHTWNINGEIIEAKDFKTEYTLNSGKSGDTAIKVKHTVVSPKGCSSEKEDLVPYSGPVASYDIRRFSICDTPVFYFKTFPDSSRTKFPLTYKWKTSSGLEINTQNFNSKFKTMGMNYVTLTVTDRNGCSSIYSDSFEVSPNMLQPLFKADPTGRFCPPLECNFQDFSKTFLSEIVAWEWDFGDGSGSQLKDPRKLYLIPGSYDISLKVTSKNGCTATLKKPGYVIVNGPRGSYDFDRGDACLPHTVEFRGKTLDSASMEWDLGDGVVKNGNNFKHTYRQPGRFIPAMILSDTLGCKYTLPPIDTIEVFDYPKAEIKMDGLCFAQPIKVSNWSESNHENKTLKSTWFFNDKLKSPGNDSLFMPENRGYQKIKLIVENVGKCKDTAESSIRIFAPIADFSPETEHACLGLPLTLLNGSKSDTSILEYTWDLGDGNTATGKDVKHAYTRPGTFTVRMIARDAMNCYDTIEKVNVAVVGDTISPPPVPIRRASVLSDNKVELVFAKYPDFDFTQYDIYKFASNKYHKVAEIKNPMDTMFVDGMTNTLNNSYCYKIRTRNLCLLFSDLSLSKEHCTIETKAKGLFEANRVNWSPYIGFDSIAKYEIWRADAEDKTNYSLLDSVPGYELTFVDTHFTCYTRQYYRIKAIQSGGFKEYSNSDTATAKPFYNNETKANMAWRVTVENNDFTRLEWLNDAYSPRGIRGYLVDKYFGDGNVYRRNMYFDADDTIFEDRNVKVNEYSYLYNIRGIDNCNDTTPYGNVSKSILLKGYFDNASQKPALSWSNYRHWHQGILRYEVERMQSDGSFTTIGSVGPDINTFVDMSAESNCSPNYIYRVRAVSNWFVPYDTMTFSLSNHAKVLPKSTLFVPNAFSPDKNSINEVFGPNGQYISRYHIQIFNRWGEKLFDSNECMKGWDGTFKNEQCQQDVYMYKIEALGADNKTYILNGTFTLLR